MGFLSNMKIGIRLNLIISLIMIIIISSLGVYTLKKQKSKIIRDTDLRMFEQVNDLANTINIQLEERQTTVDYALKIAREVLKNNGKPSFGDKNLRVLAMDQISKTSQRITIKNMIINNENVYRDYSIVDKIQQFTGATATIFQKIPEGYLRISTNVLNASGERAVDTYIPNNSPVIQMIESGKIYRGRAFVVDDYYLTAYEPIIIDDSIQGMLYVGLKETDLRSLKEFFGNKKYFESGYPFLIDSKGNFVIHPKKEGENFYNAEFFQQIISSNQLVGKTHYLWEGESKFQYFKYIERIDSYVSVSIYEKELLGIINQIRKAIIIAIIFGILIFIIINAQISKSITKVLNMGVDFAEKIASGDLSTRIKINQNDEIGLLANSLNKMAENLKESTQKYEIIFNSANDAILILDENGRILECNKKTEDMFQYKKEQMLGKTPTDFSPEYQPCQKRSQKLANKKRNEVFTWNGAVFEWKFIKMNNDLFDGEVNLNVLELNDKKYLLGIVRDITKRKKNEKELKKRNKQYVELNAELQQKYEEIQAADLKLQSSYNELSSVNKILEHSEEKLKEIFNSTSEAIIIHDDSTGRIIDCNRATFNMYGYDSLEELKELSIVDFSATERGYNQEKIEKQIKIALKRGVNTFEWLAQKKNGNFFWVEVSLKKTYISGEGRILAVVRDISERKKIQQAHDEAEKALKKSEEKYRRLTEHSPEITYIYSLNKGALYWSSKVKDILGFDLEDLKKDTLKWNKAIHPDDRPKIDEFFKNIQTGKSYTLDYRIYDIKNKIHWFNDKVFNVYKSENDIIVEGIISDITDKIRMQQKVLHAMINAEERERSRIAKDLHDGVSPVMSALKLYVQSFGNARNEELRKELAGKINITITEAVQSINEISNNISPHILQNFGLKAAVETFVEKIIELKKINIEIYFEKDYRVDENIEIALYRITTELINNALKYAKTSNVVLKYYFRQKNIFMLYKDNGRGFDIEHALKTKKGMGIFNMKNRIEALNGDFKIESWNQGGVYVEIMVPITY